MHHSYVFGVYEKNLNSNAHKGKLNFFSFPSALCSFCVQNEQEPMTKYLSK
jgi:hypothetical protein